MTWMKLSPVPATRFAKRSADAAAAALVVVVALGACTPRQPIYNVPVVVIGDTGRAAPRDTVVIGTPAPAPVGAAPAVAVGLVVDTGRVEIGSAGAFVVASEDGRELARVPAGGTALVQQGPGGASLSIRAAGGGAAPGGGAGLRLPLVVRPSGDATLTVRGNPYRGELRVQQSPRGALTVVNRLDMETYLQGVVPREIGRAAPDIYETVKAQAVAARTYAVSYLGRRSAQGFDVYATVEDQVYGGAAAEDPLANRAIRETAGEIIVYGGQPINAYYHSTCAGHTAAIEEVWNSAPVPYLRAVRDVDARGEAFDRASSRFTWTERWTHDELVTTLNRTLADSLRGRRITRINEMQVQQRTPSGRVAAMRLATDAGTFTLGRDRVRWILVPNRGGILNSSKFDVRLERSGTRVTAIVAEGGGWGHGIGMCQVGAMGRARAGQDYRQILQAYYTGVEIVRRY
jgi:stage II sporulation protein D